MIEVNGGIWTDPTETHEVHEYFFAKYGADVAEPICSFCGKTTCYIVESARINHNSKGKVISVKPVKKGVSFMIRTSGLKTLVKGEAIYLPILQCEDCAARYEATMAFKGNNWNPPDLSTRNLTTSEKDRYRLIFRAKISDLDKKRSAEMKPSNRYAAPENS